ncbi:hypothetical protein ACHAXA_002375 [Cyclostephanos tholiformis]|uniref:Carbohydrate kinase PfkB domain-containing protein n=1 Tax=Cyclostephanos tholiformis TaxID=382380 RepID=A0ABD3SRZ7_9STRA
MSGVTFESADVIGNDLSPQLLSQISSFHELGCAVVLLSLVSKGAFIPKDCSDCQLLYLKHVSGWKPGQQVRIPAFQISHGEVNANGAGDALFSGFCLAASSWGHTIKRQLCRDEAWRVTPQVAGTFASLVAW